MNATLKKQKSFHEEWAAITDEIKRLEEMRIENNREIRKLHRNNTSLTETIRQLKTKRRQLVFLAIHIPER